MDINFIVDAVIVLIVIIGIIIGVKRGFVETVAKPVRIVAGLGVAFSLCQPVGEKYIKPLIKNPLVEKLTSFVEEKCGELTTDTTASDLPFVLRMLARIFNVDVETVAEEATNSIVAAIVDALADPFVNIIGSILAFIALFIVTSIACWLIFKIIGLIFSIGPLGALNKVFGLVFGAIFALIIVWALSVGIDFVMDKGVFAEVEYVNSFTGGPLYNVVKELNPIDLILSL